MQYYAYRGTRRSSMPFLKILIKTKVLLPYKEKGEERKIMKERKWCPKEFFIAVRCFFRQTWGIAKCIFGSRDSHVVEYKDLAPIDDAVGCEEHIKALEWAVTSGRIKNIALSGPYGSGKSSIIETFLRRNPPHRRPECRSWW